MTRLCPTCGLPAPSTAAPELTRIKQRILDLIAARPGLSADDVCASIYNGSDGGPDSGRKAIHVHINQINRRLAHQGSPVRIRGSKNDGYRIYGVPACS